jgi:drug/metabolite transporter (DMT)-like permease
LKPPLSVPRATALVLLAACCFGSVTILSVVATRAGASLASVLAWRYALGSILLVLAAGGMARVRLPALQSRRLLLLGGGGQAAVAGLSLYALRYLPAGTLAFLFYTYPAWITAIAALRGTERLTTPRIVALMMSLAGIALMVGNPFAGTIHPVGVGLALASALVYAFYIPMLGRLQGAAPPSAAAAYVTGGAAVYFVIVALLGTFLLDVLRLPPDPWLVLTARLTTTAWLAVLALAVFSTLLAFIVFLRGLAVLGPVRTAIVSTIEPFFTALVGALALGQPMSRRTVVGGVMIAAAVVVLQVAGRWGEGREKSGVGSSVNG